MTPGQPSEGEADDEGGERTVEEAVRRRLAEELGGPRGSAETALPLVGFAIAYVITGEVRQSAFVGGAAALGAYGLRRSQASETRFARNGLVGMVFAAAFALALGRGEAAFLPGIIQSAAWAVALGGSLVVRWPLVGFLIGGILGDSVGWRENPAIVRLADRLTIVLLVPMVLRVAVQYPLYLAGEVAWLGAARVVLGWPLIAVALAVAGAILVRGSTPLPGGDDRR